MATSSLPVLALPHPLILLPASRFTMPVAKETGDALLALIDEADTLPIVAALPIGDHTPEWATAARVLRLVKPPARNPRQPYLVSLHGLTRVRLIHNKPTPDDLPRLPVHDVEYPPTEKVPSREAVDRFKQSALHLLDRLAKDSVQQSRKEGYTKIASMLDDITDTRTPWMADVLVGSVNSDYADKLSILGTPDAEARLLLATEIFSKQASISEVSKKIASAVDESLSKQQKEFFLRQQLAAIQRELQLLHRSGNPQSPASPGANQSDASSPASELDDDDQHEADDLADLKRKIEAMQPGSEERKMGVREWRRLKRIPAGSVENGVIRTYLEWLTSVPWPNSAPISPESHASAAPQLELRDRSFLTAARAQLDADHFGLEKIKKRLIEYLAVVRLKQLNADREAAAAAEAQAAVIEAAAAPQPTPTSQSSAEPPSPDSSSDSQLVLYDKSQSPQSLPPALKPSHSKPSLLPTPKPTPLKAPILLFVGPPGTGKTSLGQSIAKALSRPFHRIALGGVRDEAEIRGHRRTYVASSPGLIVQALRKSYPRSDPLILLDEIDKIGQSNLHGDPSAALLEVLDPEQNGCFNDHYLNVPVDLSRVLFICTANSLEGIPGPLLDRCEVVPLAGYTYDEKMHIAKRFLVPKQVKANGFLEGQGGGVEINPEALLCIVSRYTREAGVRNLERAIGSVVRFKAVEWAEYLDAQAEAQVGDGSASSNPPHYNPIVEEKDLETILGIPRWDGEEKEREERRGVVYGLVVMGQGEGGVLPVETVALPGSGKLKLTGSLGDVIKESGELALSWVKMNAYDLGVTNSRAQDPLKVPEPIDIHLHLPAGAQKKDGPSAGVAMTCAFVSLLTGARVPPHIAMTGEITLRGRVTPVGGIKEKVLGAHRAGITKVILPYANRKDVEHDVPKEIKREMEFCFVKGVREALDYAFGTSAASGGEKSVGGLEWRVGAGDGEGILRRVLVESRL